MACLHAKRNSAIMAFDRAKELVGKTIKFW
jgi:hypothetical protein